MFMTRAEDVAWQAPPNPLFVWTPSLRARTESLDCSYLSQQKSEIEFTTMLNDLSVDSNKQRACAPIGATLASYFNFPDMLVTMVAARLTANNLVKSND